MNVGDWSHKLITTMLLHTTNSAAILMSSIIVKNGVDVDSLFWLKSQPKAELD